MKLKRNYSKNKYILTVTILLSLVCIFTSVVDFYQSVIEKNEEMNLVSLKQLAGESREMLNNELNNYIVVLKSFSNMIDENHIYQKEFLNHLKKTTTYTDFQRFGIVDQSGKAVLTTGENIDVSAKEFFQKTLQGEVMITDTIDSQLSDGVSIIVSVPIYDEQTVIGVLYGVLDVDSLKLFKNADLESKEYYLHVIDSQGKYIYHSTHPQTITQNDVDLFDGLSKLEMDCSIDDIKETISEHKYRVIHVSNGKDQRVIYLTPLDYGNWYVVSVVNDNYTSDIISSLFNQAVPALMFRISVALIALGVVVIYYYRKEKKYIEKLNRQLSHNEEIYRIAASRFDNVVFVYDVKDDIVRFIHGKIGYFEQGEEIHHASVVLPQVVGGKSNLDEKIKEMIDSVQNKQESYETEITIHVDDKVYYLELIASLLFDETSQVTQCVGTLQDITVDKEKEQRLRMSAEIDKLTGLYNRAAGEKRITEILKDGKSHAFVLLDLDHFKELNDTFGHAYGDQALQEVGNILKHHFRKGDVLCRLGGDEFVAFVRNIDSEVALKIINVLIHKIQLEYSQNDEVITVHSSAGIAVVSENATSFEELYRRADIALYQAKSMGRNQCCLYKEEEE